MQCALFIEPHHNLWQKYFLLYRFRAPQKGLVQYWQLSGENKEISVPILPFYCYRLPKHLQKGISKASEANCGLYLMDRAYSSLLEGQKLPLADGRRWALATMCSRLSEEVKNWHNLQVAIEVNNAFGMLAARLVAKEARYLTLIGDNRENRRMLCDTIYEECGLICQNSSKPPHNSELIIYTAQEFSQYIAAADDANKDTIIWKGWATHARDREGKIMEGYLAEGLLMAVAWEKMQAPVLEQLQQIRSKSRYYGLSPIADYQIQ